MRVLLLVILVAFGIYACQQHEHPYHRPGTPVHQQITPLVVPSRPLPSVAPRYPGLDKVDDAWRKGPCGHIHGEITDEHPFQTEEPCHLV